MRQQAADNHPLALVVVLVQARPDAAQRGTRQMVGRLGPVEALQADARPSYQKAEALLVVLLRRAPETPELLLGSWHKAAYGEA